MRPWLWLSVSLIDACALKVCSSGLQPDWAPVALPVVPNEQGPSRLILQAIGPNLRLSLDGQTVLDVLDERYPRGLIAVGVVTWSDPVAVTFDHVQITVPR